MAILTKKDFQNPVDLPKRNMDVEQRLLDEALIEKRDVKITNLSKLHGIRTEVVYYEQMISNRQGNLVNTSPLNQFDQNSTRFRRIKDLVLLTEPLDSSVDKDAFTDLTYEGTAKLLPNTLIPNIGDYFIMEVFKVFHVFQITESNPTLIEKDSGYEIRFNMWRQDIIPENCELNQYVKEDYSFVYNHVGTEFRTILRDDEYRFIQSSRTVMYDLIKTYTLEFYHRTLNTIMCDVKALKEDVHSKLMACVSESYTNMIGSVYTEGRSIYDIDLVSFIVRNELFSASEYLHVLTEHLKSNKVHYNKSIFSAMERRDIRRFLFRFQRMAYMTSNRRDTSNLLHGRFVIEHDIECQNNCSTFSLFPENFVQKLTTYSSDVMYAANPTYTNVNDAFIDIISTYLNEPDQTRRLNIIVKIMRIVIESRLDNFMFTDDYDYSYLTFYTYPLVIFALKYATRELSLIKYDKG